MLRLGSTYILGAQRQRDLDSRHTEVSRNPHPLWLLPPIQIVLAAGFVICFQLFPCSVVSANDGLLRVALDLSIPKDVLNNKPSGRILALHINSPKQSPDMRGYAKRVMEKIDLLFEEDHILNDNGKRVCASAEYLYRIVIRSDGALELFEIAHGSASLSEEDILLRDVLSDAVYKSAPFEPFLAEHFLGFELVGLEATFKLVCKRPRFIQVRPRPQSGW